MIYNPITAVGIDVSKSKSTVAIRRPGGEVVMLPFDIQHNMEDIQRLISILRKVGGDIKIVMEHTGMNWRPLALALLPCLYLPAMNTLRFFSNQGVTFISRFSSFF